MTAAATTGPASGPRPASSTPQMWRAMASNRLGVHIGCRLVSATGLLLRSPGCGAASIASAASVGVSRRSSACMAAKRSRNIAQRGPSSSRPASAVAIASGVAASCSSSGTRNSRARMFGQADPRQVAAATHQPPRQTRHAVDDHHRLAEERGFERRRTAGDEHAVGRLQAAMGVAVDETRPLAHGRHGREERLEVCSQPARRRPATRSAWPRRGRAGAARRMQQHRRDERDLGAPAAGQQGDDRGTGGQAQLGPRRRRVRIRCDRTG